MLKAKKQKAPQDSTLRNVRAAHRREAQILKRLAVLESRVDQMARDMDTFTRAQRKY